ncbi:3'-5' exonuclease [Nitrincola alkalilacustris]|uniref:3'-5' exonuclease n=1 Tax=Nitrincola alkalilacustris TaxID=1571224 RepID=UPI00124F6620|nr:exonuclease domain-containing protein [Nitrincola alkalilacustris]
MPKRQQLLGIWLLLTGLTFFAGLALAFVLDAALAPEGTSRWMLWITAMSSSMILAIIGILLERKLFAPLRHLQVQLARLAANPDAREDFPPEGWLASLKPDLDKLRQRWQKDRDTLSSAREEGARDAARIRHELEAVLQVLETPLLLCDTHQRVLMLNPAAEQFFAHHPALGLGRHLGQLLPVKNLTETLDRLPADGTPRQILLHHEGRWLRCDLRRVSATQGEVLLTLEDRTESQSANQRWRQPLAELIPALRGHAASLTTAAEALSGTASGSDLRLRLEQGVQQESAAIGNQIDNLARILERVQLDQGQLHDTWSNDLWKALDERLSTSHITLTPIGIPAWFRADSPALLAMLEVLVELLRQHTGQNLFDAEICLGNKRVYMDLIWQGGSLPQSLLEQWREMPLSEEPLAARLGDVLNQHNSDWWSLKEESQARIRIPLPASERAPEPVRSRKPRPEFHDFSIAELPAPDATLGALPLRQLEMVVFDTETTGLRLREGDSVISIGACRILNGKLLADEAFEQLVNPGIPIPADSTVIHGLTDADVRRAPPLTIVLPRFRSFVGQGVLVAHNAAFDMLAISRASENAGITFDMPVLDTLLLSRAIDPGFEGHGLDALASRFQLAFAAGSRHTALGDARVTAELFLALLPRLEARGILTLQQALELQATMEPVRVG